MTTFLALYHGRTVNDSKLIAVSADAELVSIVAERLLGQALQPTTSADSVLNAIRRGREEALQGIIKGNTPQSVQLPDDNTEVAR